ncbi:restriction endonuclease subunit S [Undibacterium sp. WLHG33]|uniref:restriction endonuclease subunit S n=2 Tax=unclassified Undibacterium TaxID=2630295 RepID=UPI003C2BB24E
MSRSLPDGWLQESLEYFAEINPRLTNRNLLENETEVSFFKMEDVSNQAKIINRNIRRYGEVSKGFTCFQNEDVLVAKITPCFENGKGAYVDRLVNGVGFGSTEFHVLRAKKNAHPRFIYHFTNYQTFRMQGESNMTGSAGQRRVPTDFFRTYHGIFPPAEEQQKIASILTAVDEVIASTTAQINKLKDLKTGMMQELLTKGIGHTEFKDSPVGRIPKAWTFKAVGDICKVTSGGTPDRTNLEFWNGNIPWIKTGEINYTTIYSAEEYITELGLKNSSTKLIPAGSVLMAMYGQGITRGKVALLGIDACLNQACLAMLPNNELDKYFLFYFFSKEYENLRLLVQEGTQKNLNAGIVKEILLPLPPMDEQVEIRKRLQAVDINIESKQRKLEIVVDLKKALMQDLLTGNVRVP